MFPQQQINSNMKTAQKVLPCGTATKEILQTEHQNIDYINTSLAHAIVKNVERVFEKFGDKEFLTAVEKCYRINVNQSFHVVRSMCP